LGGNVAYNLWVFMVIVIISICILFNLSICFLICSNHPPLENESIRRTKTDSEIRSQSAPLLDGVGVIGG
jgi:uncharacterized membrane protein